MNLCDCSSPMLLREWPGAFLPARFWNIRLTWTQNRSVSGFLNGGPQEPGLLGSLLQMHIFRPHPGPTESRLGKRPVVTPGRAGGKAWFPQGPLCTVSKGGGGSPKGCRVRRGPAWEGGPAGPTMSLPQPPGPGGRGAEPGPAPQRCPLLCGQGLPCAGAGRRGW